MWLGRGVWSLHRGPQDPRRPPALVAGESITITASAPPQLVLMHEGWGAARGGGRRRKFRRAAPRPTAPFGLASVAPRALSKHTQAWLARLAAAEGGGIGRGAWTPPGPPGRPGIASAWPREARGMRRNRRQGAQATRPGFGRGQAKCPFGKPCFCGGVGSGGRAGGGGGGVAGTHAAGS